MKRAISWFAEHGVAANLLMVLILVAGALTAPNIRKQIFPDIDLRTITVRVPYLGASPEEVEEGVILRIEEAIQGVEGVEEVNAVAVEGLANVTVEVLPGYEVPQVLNDVKSRVDAIETFPEDAERPVVSELIPRNEVLNIAISGDAPEHTLKRIAEIVRDDLARLENITAVEITNARPYEISVEVSRRMLREYELTFAYVVQAIRGASVDLPGGSVETQGGEVLLRTEGQADFGREFEKIPLLTRPDGARLLLGDLAKVEDGFEDTDQQAWFDGEPAVMVRVFRVGDQSALDVAAAAKQYVEETRAEIPEGIRLTVWRDNSVYLQQRLDLMMRNGLMGLALVLILLTLFLRPSAAFWVALGIPISFLGAIALLPFLDVSINMVSLFAFILVLGIVVDDAIVIGENIYTHIQRGEHGVEAAVKGAVGVMTPVTFAVLTTIVAFVPLMTVPGFVGDIWFAIPVIVITSLVFSLVEAYFILPRHLSHLKPDRGQPDAKPARWWLRLQEAIAGSIDKVANRLYRPGLRFALHWRYATIALGIVLILLTASLFAGGFIDFVFFPNIGSEYVIADLTMPLGTPPEVTRRGLEKLEAAADQVQEDLGGPGEDGLFRYRLVSLGEQPFLSRGAGDPGSAGQTVSSGAHLGEISIELTSAETRGIDSIEIVDRWRELTGTIPGAVELAYTGTAVSAGAAINVQLSGPDLEELRSVANKLKQRLEEIDGVYEISDSYRRGKKELKLDIRPEAEQLGLTLRDLAQQTRFAFYGAEAQRILRRREEVKVMVRFRDAERNSLADVKDMLIRTDASAQVPFSTVANAELGFGYAAINRADRERTVNVTADVDSDRANANEIIASLEATTLPELLDEHPRVSYGFEGEQQEQAEALSALRRGLMYASIVIFVLIAIPFRSYFQPAIVLFEVPLGMVGAVAGHLLVGEPVSILSVTGMVALAGVVINDSLVLVDHTNQRVAEGTPVGKAIEESGVSRFRPIWLTSLTTFAGLTPLLLEESVQAQFLIPMAISLAFGVLFSTFVTLGFLPCCYLVLEDAKKKLVRST